MQPLKNQSFISPQLFSPLNLFVWKKDLRLQGLFSSLQINLASPLKNDLSYSNSYSANHTLPKPEIELFAGWYLPLNSSIVALHVFCATFSLNIVQRRALGKETFAAYSAALKTFQLHSYLSRFEHFPKMRTRPLSFKMGLWEHYYHQFGSLLVLILMLTLYTPTASCRRAGQSIMTPFMAFWSSLYLKCILAWMCWELFWLTFG